MIVANIVFYFKVLLLEGELGLTSNIICREGVELWHSHNVIDRYICNPCK